MADPSYRVREAAVRSVAAAGHFAVPALKRKLEEKPSREVEHGCKRALAIIYKSDYYAVYPTISGWKEKALPGWKEKRYPCLRVIDRIGFEELRELKFLLRASCGKARIEASDHYWDKDTTFYYNTKDGTFTDPGECERYATQLYVRALLDAGVARDVVQEFVNRLAQIEMKRRAP
jgi:hypothetical protein